MANSEDHLAELTDPVYHQNGACVVRHASAQQKECKYEQNGYDKTLASRSHWYNAPTRYKLGLVDWNKIRPKMVKSPAGYKLKSFVAPGKGEKPHPHLWNIGEFDNFVPGGKGFQHPYLHNWHHMIANEMLFKMLYDKTYGTKLLQVLMVAKYNLNHERNIVLLPKEDRVGVIVKWPVHPNNHGTYDKYAAAKLSTLKARLKQSLGTPKAHPIKAKNVGNYAEELHAISDELLLLLEQLGREQPGVHINKVKKYGAAIEAKLQAAGTAPP
jgi:hypothetical protein